ncbi:MAG: hypothetical protein ACOC4J_06375 [Bacteroidota bacterium]
MISIELQHENRLRLTKDSGKLIHVFGEGYCIIDENGREVNAFKDEKEFNRLIEKFRYRHFLMEKLKSAYADEFDFGENNTLLINGKSINDYYWDLPKNEDEVDLFFNHISSKYKDKLNCR